MTNDAHRVPDRQLFVAGDVRANENIELLSLHTLFLREHNRLADLIHRTHPGLGDEAIYQRARTQVIAEMEVITYKEWLPALLGPGALRPYTGYKPGVNPGIANEFSTAAFRLGHSLLGDDVLFLGNNGLPVADEMPLSQVFFNPALLTARGIGSILKYLASDPSSEFDTRVVSSVRNFPFGPPGSGGLDLASLNIQRGRDHGLADYNTLRAAFVDFNRDGRWQAGEPSLAGWKVQLINADTGKVDATTITNGAGRYCFDVAGGLRLGRYRVRTVLRSGLTRTTRIPIIALTRGDSILNRVDLGMALPRELFWF